jgi:hypothetical protein
MLTGQLGDVVMNNWIDDTEQVADLLARRRWRGAAREAFAWSRALKRPVYGVFWRGLQLSFGERGGFGTQVRRPGAIRSLRGCETGSRLRVHASAEMYRHPDGNAWPR